MWRERWTSAGLILMGLGYQEGGSVLALSHGCDCSGEDRPGCLGTYEIAM